MALYQDEVRNRPVGAEPPAGATPFTRELVEGVGSRREELDAIVERLSVDWPLDWIAPLERNVLRVALYELLHRPDVPAEVAIDEAVEAAKELCGADAPAFINGILGASHREGALSP